MSGDPIIIGPPSMPPSGFSRSPGTMMAMVATALLAAGVGGMPHALEDHKAQPPRDREKERRDDDEARRLDEERRRRYQAKWLAEQKAIQDLAAGPYRAARRARAQAKLATGHWRQA